jgi:hypothetical protein
MAVQGQIVLVTGAHAVGKALAPCIAQIDVRLMASREKLGASGNSCG